MKADPRPVPIPGQFRLPRGVLVTGDVAQILLTAGGLQEFYRLNRGANAKVDAVLADLRAEAGAYLEAARARHCLAAPASGSAPSEPSLLSTADVAARYGRPLRSVQRAARTGQLRAQLVGGRYLIDPGNLAVWLDRTAPPD